MGFFKGLGEVAGTLVGLAVALPVELVGEVTDSKYIKDIAEGAFKATANTGKIVGSIADGTVKCASGIIQKDAKKADEGFGEVVGVCDIVGGLDADHDGVPDFLEHDNVNDTYAVGGGNPNGGTGPSFVYENEPPQYWVNAPHTQNGGYWRTMPDASISNNLSSKV